jgi:hypothetical protein
VRAQHAEQEQAICTSANDDEECRCAGIHQGADYDLDRDG